LSAGEVGARVIPTYIYSKPHTIAVPSRSRLAGSSASFVGFVAVALEEDVAELGEDLGQVVKRPELSCSRETINRSNTHTDREQHPQHTHTHDKNKTPNPQTNTPHKHLTTLEGGATTVRATSHARVGSQSR